MASSEGINTADQTRDSATRWGLHSSADAQQGCIFIGWTRISPKALGQTNENLHLLASLVILAKNETFAYACQQEVEMKGVIIRRHGTAKSWIQP